MTTTWRRGVRTGTVGAVLVGLVLTAGPAVGASTAEAPVLTKERLYELARSRTYGTPVEIPVPGMWPHGRWLTDSGVVVGSTDMTTVPRHFRWIGGEVQMLPALPGDHTDLVGVNEAGQVLGYSRTWARWPEVEPFVWQVDGTVTALTDAGDWRSVTAISDDGTVLGQLMDERVVTWRDGTVTEVPLPVGEDGGRVYATLMNARGEIAGSVSHDDGERKVYVWRGGVPTLLPVPPGVGVDLMGITDHGDVTGTLTGASGKRLVFWEHGARLRDIDPHNTYQMSVTGITPHGIAVGNASRYHLQGAVRVDTRRGAVVPLPSLGGADSWVGDLHDLDIAVGSAMRAGSRRDQPLMWVTSVPVPLGTVLDGVQAYSGGASAINARGQVLGSLWFTEHPEGSGPRVVLWDLVPRR